MHFGQNLYNKDMGGFETWFVDEWLIFMLFSLSVGLFLDKVDSS